MMKALVHEGASGVNGLSLQQMQDPQPKAGEVIVKLKAVGLNHRDLFILDCRMYGSDVFGYLFTGCRGSCRSGSYPDYL